LKKTIDSDKGGHLECGIIHAVSAVKYGYYLSFLVAFADRTLGSFYGTNGGFQAARPWMAGQKTH
jgi:hypothetical protein